MTGESGRVVLIMVGGRVVPLPAVELADALDRYAAARVGQDRRTRAPRRGETPRPAFQSGPWGAASEALRAVDHDPEISQIGPVIAAGGELGADRLPERELITLTEWATRNDVAERTARDWARTGRFPRATQLGNTWHVPADTPRPTRRRRKRTR